MVALLKTETVATVGVKKQAMDEIVDQGEVTHVEPHVTPELQPKDTVNSKETLLVVMAVVEAQDGGQEKLAVVIMELVVVPGMHEVMS